MKLKLTFCPLLALFHVAMLKLVVVTAETVVWNACPTFNTVAVMVGLAENAENGCVKLIVEVVE